MGEDLAQLELVFRAVVLAAFADGQPSPVELKVLAAQLAKYPELVAGRDLKQLVVETYKLIKTRGAEAVLEDIVAGLYARRYQELAFTLASKVIAADGETAGGEAMMLGELQERFGFTPEDVLRLL